MRHYKCTSAAALDEVRDRMDRRRGNASSFPRDIFVFLGLAPGNLAQVGAIAYEKKGAWATQPLGKSYTDKVVTLAICLSHRAWSPPKRGE